MNTRLPPTDEPATDLVARLSILRTERDDALALASSLRLLLADRVAADLQQRGFSRIALYGAGRHTPAIIRQPWLARGLRVVAVLDDAPRAAHLAGVPICTPAAVPEAIDAVVISSDAHESALFSVAINHFGPRGVPVLRIYGDPPPPPDRASITAALERDHALSSADAAWLMHNRAERHDASLPMLPPERTEAHWRRYELAASLVAARPGAAVIDIACGTGYGSSLLVRCGARSVLGVDRDADSIAYAQRRFARPGVPLKFIVGDAQAIPAGDATIDVLASFETIEHVPDPDAMLMEVRRVLTPSGVAVFSTPNDWGVTDHHEHSFTTTHWRELILRHFNSARFIGQRTGIEPRTPALPPGLFNLHDDAPAAEWLLAIASAPR